MAKTAQQLQKAIMRRVYYAFALKLVSHPLVAHGVLLVASVFFLTYFVSFPNIFANMLEVKVGELHTYFIESMLHTEIWTVVLLGFAFVNVLILSLRRREPMIGRGRNFEYA